MNRRTTNILMAVAIIILTCLGREAGGQEPQQQPTAKPVNQSSQLGNTYLLEFMLSEIEGSRKVNVRSYVMRAQSGGITNKIRVQSRVPITVSTVQDPKTTQFQYVDVGMSIDCRVQELERDALLDFVADFSSVAPDQTSNLAPAIGHVVTQANAVVELGKQTVLSKMDDPGSKRTIELEVTATRLK
jgi:hypothetical protein